LFLIKFYAENFEPTINSADLRRLLAENSAKMSCCPIEGRPPPLDRPWRRDHRYMLWSSWFLHWSP